MSDDVLITHSGPVMTLTINRPEKRNALTPDALQCIASSLDAAARTDDVRAVIIGGSGTESFSAGYDIGSLGRTDGNKASGAQILHDCIRSVTQFPYPVIAQIHGHAIGAGMHLAVACDLRLASTTARFAMPTSRMGIVYPLEGYELFLNTFGAAAAKMLFLTGSEVFAQEALRLGIVTSLVPPEELDDRAQSLAEELAEKRAPLSLKATKSIINGLASGPPSDEERAEAERLRQQALKSDDLREATAAFRERRDPVFHGK